MFIYIYIAIGGNWCIKMRTIYQTAYSYLPLVRPYHENRTSCTLGLRLLAKYRTMNYKLQSLKMIFYFCLISRLD